MCQNLIHLESLVSKRTAILARIEKELLLLCRKEKLKPVGKSTLRSFGGISCWCCERIGLVDGAQERLAKLYSDLETMNDEISLEQQRRQKIMKKLDTMEAGKGRKDIDYILASPFIDEDVFLNKIYSKAPSLPTVVEDGLGKGHDELGGPVDSDEDYNNYVKLSDEKKKRKPFAKAKHAIKRYTRSVMDSNIFGRPVNDNNIHLPKEVGTKKIELIEHHTNEVSDKAFIQVREASCVLIYVS